MDICLNFMERWAKQAGKAYLKDMTHLDDHNDIHLPEGFEAFAVRAGGYSGAETMHAAQGLIHVRVLQVATACTRNLIREKCKATLCTPCNKLF